jgi:hypothetical protein
MFGMMQVAGGLLPEALLLLQLGIAAASVEAVHAL